MTVREFTPTAPGVPPVPKPPPLQNGDRLKQAEFHRRYAAMPPGVKAELIGGVVYMPSPQRDPHGYVWFEISTILGVYKASTRGTFGSTNTTTILDDDSEPQPDLSLRLLPEFGGRSRLNEKEYLVGPPELIIEIAHSTVAIDLHAKKEDYRRTGVQEYLVFCIGERELRAFDLAGGTDLAPDADGVFRSRRFPGLWFEPAAVWAADTARSLAVLRQGLESPEHGRFVEKLHRTGR